MSGNSSRLDCGMSAQPWIRKQWTAWVYGHLCILVLHEDGRYNLLDYGPLPGRAAA